MCFPTGIHATRTTTTAAARCSCTPTPHTTVFAVVPVPSVSPRHLWLCNLFRETLRLAPRTALGPATRRRRCAGARATAMWCCGLGCRIPARLVGPAPSFPFSRCFFFLVFHCFVFTVFSAPKVSFSSFRNHAFKGPLRGKLNTIRNFSQTKTKHKEDLPRAIVKRQCPPRHTCMYAVDLRRSPQ